MKELNNDISLVEELIDNCNYLKSESLSKEFYNNDELLNNGISYVDFVS